MTALRDHARGRWLGVLPIFGVSPAFLTGKHGPCPFCGGKDRWRFDDKDGDGTWICTHCGAGDGVALVMRVRGIEFKEAARLIEKEIGNVTPTKTKAAIDPEKAKAAKNKLWQEAKPFVPGDPVALYLNNRGILGLWASPASTPSNLRYHSRCRYQDGLEGAPSYHPAMIAMVTGADGKPSTLHRTYLTMDGKKADVPKPKKVMTGSGDMRGKAPAIRLMPVRDGVLGVAEGIENALSASIIHNVPCWALVSSGLMKTWEPPPEVTDLWIFGDNDPHFAGLAAASALAHRVSGSGEVKVNLTIPERLGEDWADVLVREGAHPVRTAA